LAAETALPRATVHKGNGAAAAAQKAAGLARDKENAMTFVPVPNTAQAELRWTVSDQLVENTLYFEHTGAILTADLVDLAGYLETWATTVFIGSMPSNVVWRECYVTDLTTQTAETYTSNLEVGDAGTQGAAAPNNVTIAVSFRTAVRGRSGRGRNYVPAITAANVTANVVSSAFRNAIQSYYLNMQTSLPAGWEWVVVSRYTNGAPRVTGQTYPVTAVVFSDSYVDSQRRRLPGRGQ
jgi:hypothetical protein